MADILKCPRCSSDLPPGFPEGICPTCLMQQGLSPSTLDHSSGSPSESSRNRHWIPPTPAELAPRFPQLEIVELLGQGGMGAVYKVRQKDLDRWAALKVLPDDVAHDPTFSERFQREARALALLGHQHIVIVYEFGQREGVYFLLMEYIDGVTLRQAIRAGQVSSKDALSIVAQICDALQFAHEEGVVHRDIKPENILIDKRGRVKIADFGLAKMLGRSVAVPTLTGTHQIMGTPIYMAPEQMEGTRGVDHRADIFSLGVVFYELLTGELPLGRFAPPSQKYQLDVRLDEVVLRTLEKEPDRRYQQASEVKNDVESIRNQHLSSMQAAPSTAEARSRGGRRQPPVERPVPQRQGSRFLIIFVVLAILLIMFAGTLSVPLLVYMWSSARVDSATVSTMTEQERRRSLNLAEQARFQESVRREQMDQERRKQSLEQPHDRNEVDSAIRFVRGIPELNPSFGPPVISSQQRQGVNQILASIHRKYLDVERQHTKTERYADGSQFSVVTPFPAQIAELENELWTAIDAQVLVAEQKWLRQNLPLFADSTKPFPSAGGLPPVTPQMSGGMGAMMMSPGGTIGGTVSSDFPQNIRYAQLLGWKDPGSPIRILIARRGTWYHWSVEYEMKMLQNSANAYYQIVKDQGEDPQLPSGLQRFWSNDQQVSSATESEKSAIEGAPATTDDVETPKPAFDESSSGEQPTLTSGNTPVAALSGTESIRRPMLPIRDKLQELDSMRAGQQTQWPEVQRRINELLSSYPKREEQGQIYWQATMVYGQSDINGHAAEVTYYAKRALALVLDPSQRGWLYMYLGNAAEARDIDPGRYLQNRAEAARWYIKGFAELSAFDLPDEPPELPVIGKFEKSKGNTTEDILDDIASQVRHEAQMKRRQEVQTIRDLIHHRTIYIDRLKDLFGRVHDLYDKDANRVERLRPIATEVLTDPEAVERLLHLVIPSQG